MSSRRLAVAITVIAALTLPASVAAETLGFVDMQRILEESAVGKRLQAELRKDFEPKAQSLGKEEQELRGMQETLKRDAALMSKDQVEKKETELKKRIEAYQQEAGKTQQALVKVQQEKGKEVLGPARKAIDAIAKKKKMTMVVEGNMAGILYLDKGVDLTSEVIKLMDTSAK